MDDRIFEIIYAYLRSAKGTGASPFFKQCLTTSLAPTIVAQYRIASARCARMGVGQVARRLRTWR
jgi:hypothetical protein